MAERQTLLFYINSLRRGGAERVLLQLAARFAGAGYRAVFVTSFRAEDEYPVPPGVERISIEDAQIPQKALKRNASRISALRRLCIEYKPAAAPEKEYFNSVFRFVARHILPRADGCVFQTEDAKSWFPERLQKKSTVIMNQVSQRFFDEVPSDTHRGVAAVGRLSPQKNHAMLIRAYAALGDVDEPLTIYGEGPLREELEALVKELGLEGRVFLPGQSADISRDIKGAKLFVLSSDYEGMPNVLLEAMALGLPCIATDCPCGGPASVIEDGVSGMLIPVGDEKALTEKMRLLLSSDETRGRLSQNAKIAAAFDPRPSSGSGRNMWKP